jgi:hypothetical protein
LTPDLVASIPPLGEVLRLRRGAVDLPREGGPELLRTIGWSIDPARRLRAHFGERLIMLVDWGSNGEARVQSVHQYGSATSHPKSAHFGDQSPLFARGEFRPRLQ